MQLCATRVSIGSAAPDGVPEEANVLSQGIATEGQRDRLDPGLPDDPDERACVRDMILGKCCPLGHTSSNAYGGHSPSNRVCHCFRTSFGRDPASNEVLEGSRSAFLADLERRVAPAGLDKHYHGPVEDLLNVPEEPGLELLTSELRPYVLRRCEGLLIRVYCAGTVAGGKARPSETIERP